MDGLTATKTIRSLKHPDAKPVKIENVKIILCDYSV